MASTRFKSTYDFTQENGRARIQFKEPSDYILVDINESSIFLSLGFNAKPYDEMITIRLKNALHLINAKESSYVHDKSSKLLVIDLVKKCESDEFDLKFDHKFVEKKNHPLANPRGYSVQKPANKNWDKIIATLDDSEEEEPDANSALKKIYDGCDDDTRRAMEKSLYESNGTVLNMNWGEVGSKRVDPYKSYDESKPFEGFDKR